MHHCAHWISRKAHIPEPHTTLPALQSLKTANTLIRHANAAKISATKASVSDVPLQTPRNKYI